MSPPVRTQLLSTPSAASAPADTARPTPLARQPHVGYEVSKRALDVVVASIALLLFLPFFLVVAVAVRLESRGPAIYRHRRVGRWGRHFDCYKFRSMYDGAAQDREHLRHLDVTGGPVFKTASDPRITRLGRLLRKTSVDELPQLWCVLRGDMSLVGPRPLPVEDYDPERVTLLAADLRSLMSARLQVKPGVTCIWQVSGRSLIAFERWMELDAEYLRRRSLLMDLRLLLQTIPAVLSSRGAI